MIKLNKSQQTKIDELKKFNIYVRIIDGKPNEKGYGGWIGLVFCNEGICGILSDSFGCSYSTLGSALNKVALRFKWNFDQKNRLDVLIMRSYSKEVLWVKDVFESLIQPF